MGGIKVLFIYFLKNVNSYLFNSEILNSVLEKLIPTYLLVKSLIPSLKGGGINFNSPVSTTPSVIIPVRHVRAVAHSANDRQPPE